MLDPEIRDNYFHRDYVRSSLSNTSRRMISRPDGSRERVEQLGVVPAADEFKFETKYNSPSLARLIACSDGTRPRLNRTP